MAIVAGIFYGIMLYAGKIYALRYNKPWIDIVFGIIRYAGLFAILYSMATILQQNSILLIILFVSSYLSTVAILVLTS